VLELVAGLLEDLGEHSLPLVEEDGCQLLADQEPGAEGRHREERGPVQDPSEGLGERRVGHRVRGREVDGTGHVVLQQEADGADLVGQADPAHPLTA
jgi:hypothetical protein